MTNQKTMSRRGRRYDEKPKLNIKRIIATILSIGVIVMVVISVKNMFSSKPLTQEVSTETAYFTSYSNGKWGVINNNGEIIVSCYYDEMIIIPDKNKDLFVCFYADENSVASQYTTKVINKNGENILTEYTNIVPIENSNKNEIWYENNVLKFEKDGKYGLIDFDGKLLLDPEYDEIYSLAGIEKNIIIKKDDKLGLVNTSMGEKILECKYDEIETLIEDDYKNGYIVKENGKYGVVSANAKVIFESKYDEIQNVTSDGYYFVTENGEKKLINEIENKIINLDYDELCEINGNYLVVSKNSKYGIVNLNGEDAVNEEYDSLKYIFDKYYIASKNNLFGIISFDNEVIVDFDYTDINYVKEADFIELENPDYTTDILNRNFEKVLASIIVSELNLDDGYIRVRSDSEYKYYNFNFEEKKAQDILKTSTLFLVKENGKYGYENKNGERVVDCIYDDAKEQNEYGFCAINKDGKWGVLKSDGTVVLQPSVDLNNSIYIDFIGEWHIDDELNIYTK